MSYPKIILSFRIDNGEFARRSWWAVPRIGEQVILADAVFEVVSVLWGCEEPCQAERDFQRVNVGVKLA